MGNPSSDKQAKSPEKTWTWIKKRNLKRKPESLLIAVQKNAIRTKGRRFTNGPGDLDSIPSCVIPKTLKMVLDTALLNTQQYKVHIKGKVELSWERSSALPYTSVQ